MLNGTFHIPTVFLFGKGMISRVGAEVSRHAKKALLHFGRHSLKQSGLHARVVQSLKASEIECIELGGVQPNPRAELVYEGIELCRKNNIGFILAAGGGSVIDSAKAISIGTPFKGDFFEIFEGRHQVETALTIGTIQTFPGTGSESNAGSVITHEGKKSKLALTHPLLFPAFSILDPEITCTLSGHQTACGIVDAMSHVLERYFTQTPFVDCTDRICEGLLKTLMKYALLVKNNPLNYDVRAEIMWACKLAHDNTAGFGRKQDWASHTIAHELGARYDAVHGELLSVIFPAWMQHAFPANTERFVQFAERVFDIPVKNADSDDAIRSSIARLQRFFRELGMPATLFEAGVRDKTQVQDIAAHCVRPMPSGTIGNFVRLTPADIQKIIESVFDGCDMDKAGAQ